MPDSHSQAFPQFLFMNIYNSIIYKSYTIIFNLLNINLLDKMMFLLDLTLPSLEVKQVVLLS